MPPKRATAGARARSSPPLGRATPLGRFTNQVPPPASTSAPGSAARGSGPGDALDSDPDSSGGWGPWELASSGAGGAAGASSSGDWAPSNSTSESTPSTLDSGATAMGPPASEAQPESEPDAAPRAPAPASPHPILAAVAGERRPSAPPPAWVPQVRWCDRACSTASGQACTCGQAPELDEEQLCYVCSAAGDRVDAVGVYTGGIRAFARVRWELGGECHYAEGHRVAKAPSLRAALELFEAERSANNSPYVPARHCRPD